MNKEKAEKILKILDQTYPELPVPLNHRSAFELLIAVILSAQCTDERVNQVTPNLFPKDRAAMPQDILDLGPERVKEIIHSCGYHNQKTKALLGTSQALLKASESTKKGEDFVPSDFDELTALAGVGAKTAQVVQTQWFNMPAFPVDTHVHRVSNRIGFAKSGKNRDKTERQVKKRIPKKNWSDLHLQLIFLGRSYCTAYKPKCGTCPLLPFCEWKEKENYL